jgi:hypothetical protein
VAGVVVMLELAVKLELANKLEMMYMRRDGYVCDGEERGCI